MSWFVLMIFLAIPLVLVLGAVLIGVLLVLRIGRSSEGRRLDEDEARTMQEIYQGLEKMEKRVESLETILLDHEGKDTQ